MASLIQRGNVHYIQYCVAGKARRITTGTDSLQLAKEKLRQLESSLLRGEDSPLPTRTPIAQVVGIYVNHIRTYKTPKSAQTDVYYLREVFGSICPELQITSRKSSALARKRPPKPGQDRRRRIAIIDAPCFEQINTAQIATFISGQLQCRDLAPKTANRYREILVRLFNWAMQQGGVHIPGDRNPAARVQRYKEHAPEIRFLTLADIETQLHALSFSPQLHAMVAVYIYAGLRREELLWLAEHKIINRLARTCKLSTRYGDEDVWEYFLNSPETADKWFFVRDSKANLIYYCQILVFSETKAMRELIMSEVKVYSNVKNTNPELLSESAIRYICRARDDLAIDAVPNPPEKPEEKEIANANK